MNWKIIFQLSIFGLIMAFATVSLIPENVEPAFWIVIFIFCAYVIAKTCSGNYFWQGFLLSMINCIWITAAHIAFRETYEAHHPNMLSLADNMPRYLAVHPRLAMTVMGPVFGAMFGLVLGVFSLIASKIVHRTFATRKAKA